MPGAATSPAVHEQRTTESVHFVVADSSALLVEAVSKQLQHFPSLAAVGLAVDVKGLMERLRTTHPDVCVIGADLYRQGFRALRDDISIRTGQTKLAIFADDLPDSMVELALRNRVAGFLSTGDSLNDVANAIQKVATAQIVISRNLAERITVDPATRQPIVVRRSQLSKFSDKQLEVLIHLARGLRVRDIAKMLYLSERSVESHKFRLMKRLGIRDRVELSQWCIREGLIRI